MMGQGGSLGKTRLSEAEEKHVKAAGERAIKRQRLKDGGSCPGPDPKRQCNSSPRPSPNGSW